MSSIPFQSDSQPQSRYQSIKNELLKSSQEIQTTAKAIWSERKLYEKVIIVLVLIGVVIFGILMLIYHQILLNYVVEYSDKWREYTLTKVILLLCIFLVSFPPLIGFSLLSSIVGIIFGISFQGWLILACSSITGSVVAFLLFRHVLNDQAQKIVNSHHKLYAFSTILKEDKSFWILAMIRLCPLPYSLTNGALAAIPGVSTTNFFLGSLISSPKLILYLFVGTKLKHMGEDKSFGDKFMDLLSIILAGVFMGITGYVLYWKMTAKLRELDSNDVIDLEQSVDLNLNQNVSKSYEDDDDFLIDDDPDESNTDKNDQNGKLFR